MRFSTLLAETGIARDQVTLLMHNTTLEPLRSQLPWMAANRPDLFAAYQGVHSDRASATIRKRPLVASFAVCGQQRHLFLGLFAVAGAKLRPRREIYADQRYRELARDFGATDVAPDRDLHQKGEQYLFDLRPDNRLAPYAGRIEIASPGGRTYARLATTTDPEITAMHARPANDPPMPDWRELILTAGLIRNLPEPWRIRLCEWRGIYLITDSQDGQRYVGAAYGAENMLGRWQAHIRRDAGITAQLRQRDPQGFRFSILELTSPAAMPQDVLACEAGWKIRLHTRDWGLNDN